MIFILGLIISSIAVFFLFIYNNSINNPLKIKDSSIYVEVKEGQGFYDILNDLDKQGYLRNKFAIKINLSINKQQIELKPGTYDLEKGCTLNEIITILEGKHTDKSLIKLTIPEGYTLEEIAETVEKDGIAKKDEFIKCAENYNDIPWFVKKQKDTRYTLEGYLYPDTYYIQKGNDSNVVISMMLNRFEEVLKEVEKDNNITIDENNISDIITKASIIEKEAKVEKDRKLISSVIDNRISKKMKLQIDATVIYAINEKVDVVLYRHLKKDSPYNTYMYSGLPAGPISNPGKECISAAVAPDETNYLYYVLKKDESHYFTDNYKDFLAKKKELGY